MSRNLFTSSRLSSGDKDIVSLTNGFGYDGGSTPGNSATFAFTLMDQSFTALAWDFDIEVKGSVTAAAAGPGWGTGTFNNELYLGLGSDTSISLGGGAPFTQAGFVFGVIATLSVKIRISGWVGVEWKGGGWDGHFENVWGTITDVNTQKSFNLLDLLRKAVNFLVKKLGAPKALSDILQALEPVGASGQYELAARTSSPLKAITESTTQLEPKVAARIDVSDLVDVIKLFNETLKKVGSSVQFGPSFGVSLPIDIQVQGIVLDSAVFSVTGARTANGKRFYDSDRASLLSGTPPGSLGSMSYLPATVGFQYRWSWRVELVIGVFCKIDIFWVASVDRELTFGLLKAFGFDTTVGSNIRDRLTNQNFRIKQTVAREEAPRLFNIVFEEPEAVSG